MTVHAVQVVISPSQESNPSTEPSPSPPDWVPQLLENRFSNNVNHTKVLEGEERSLEHIQDPGHPEQFRGHKRYDYSANKTTLLDDVENSVAIDAKWYEIRYHQCTHDEASPTECGGWTVERSKGTIPDGV